MSMEETKLPLSAEDLMDDGHSSPGLVKTTGDGVVLIPRPSSDPRDPLNWPMSKKVPILFALCIATFAGFTASLGGQMVLAPQAKLYGKTTVQMAYQVPIANAGMIAGGFLWFPFSHKIGRCSTAFWSLLGVIVCQIWSAEMTHKHQYGAFMASRFFTGFFGTVTGVIGPRMLVDMFFLHQRGRVFTIFHCFLDMGTVAGPTISAFVAYNRSWTSIFWWTLGLSAFGFILEFIFLQDTTWNRTEGADNTQTLTPNGFVASRIATFFPGTAVTPKTTFGECLKVGGQQFQIMATPAMLLNGFFMLVSFGFYVAMNAVTPVWVQKPIKAGGYAFTSKENALFSFNHWVGLALAVVYGQLVSDRLPLYLCSRRGGKWKPEYRLHALWFPALICAPIGLGVFGATLYFHWHWIILAVAQAIVTFGAESCIPITINYACEIFTQHPAEVAIVMNTYRIIFGLTVTFYITPWVATMKFQWTYGLMAFLQVGAFFLIMLLMWKGHEIRKYSFGNLLSSEEGEQVVEEKKAQ